MDDFKPNSHRFKEEKKVEKEERKLEKVVQGTARTRKKSEVRKLTDVFISEDAANVKNYVLSDVLIPAIKKAIVDIVTDGVNMIFYGDTKPRGSSGASKVSYGKYYDRRDGHPGENRTRSGYSYDDVVVNTRGEAEDVLERLDEALSTYGVVSVGDLYDLVGISGSYTDNNYGWTNLRNADIVRVRDGYMLKMPKALPIK